MTARDDPPLLLIGALAARCGKSVHAIRWYAVQGLVPGRLKEVTEYMGADLACRVRPAHKPIRRSRVRPRKA